MTMRFSQADIACILSSLALAKYLPDALRSLQKQLSVQELACALRLLPDEQYRSFVTEACDMFCCEESEACIAKETLRTVNFLDALLAIIATSHEHTPSIRFYTSGSTGKPQQHQYPLAVLHEEVLAVAPLLPTCRRIVSVMPTHHIFGCVFSILLPKQLEVPVVRLPPVPTATFFNELATGDLLLAFPLFWQAILALLQQQGTHAPQLPPQVNGITSTAPCPQDVIEGLLDAPKAGYALSAMVEVYGSTETSALGVRTNGRGAYTLLPVWKRRASDAADASSAIIRVRQDGSSGSVQHMPDRVQWHDASHFTVQGRTDHAVQVGGVNVYPQRIAATICTHPAVKECSVRLMRKEEGARLKAFIVPDTDCDKATELLTGAVFRQWLAQHLSVAARPKSIRLGTTLPVTSMGKLADW